MTTLTATPHTLQASLIEALAGPQPERALEQAFHQLSRGGDMPLLLAMVKALVRIGLAGIAVRLLHAGGGLLAAEPQIASLAEQLAALPSGGVPRASLDSHLHANLEAFLPARQYLRSVEHQLHQLNEDFHVFRSVKGNMYAIRNGSNHRLEFVFPFSDHAAQAETVALPAVDLTSSYQLIGVPSVSLWHRLLALRTASGFRPPIDLIEPETEVFALWLSMLDDVDIWRDERVAVFVGPDAVANHRDFLTTHATRSPAVHSITSHRPRWQAPPAERNELDSLANAIAVRRRRENAEVDRLYTPRDASFWRSRFKAAGRNEPPLKIVGFTSRYSTVMQYSMRDLAFAFRRCRCEFNVVMQPNDFTASVNVADAIRSHQPDLIVVINHLRREFADPAQRSHGGTFSHSQECENVASMPDNVPYVCWIQDHMQPLWSRESGASVSEFDLVVGHGRDVMVSLYGYPPEQFIATSNLTAPDVFSAEPIDPRDLEPYRCDVSYVGHGSETPEQLVVEMSEGNLPLRRYLHAIMQAAKHVLAEHDSINTMEMIEMVLEAERTSGHPSLAPGVRRAAIIPAAQRIVDRVLRHQTLEWTAEWARARGRTFRVYGRGWENHSQLKSFACGEIEHGEPLRRLYQASAISLQINGYSSLHQRLLDGLASGACMLSRYNPSDFIRAPHATISRFIEEHRITTLSELIRAAQRDEALRAAMNEAETLVGTRLAPMSDPIRAHHVKQHLACASMSPAEFTDEGLFRVLKDQMSIPPRTAGDIGGFAATAFRTRQKLHDQLDALVDQPAARQALAEPMKQSVLTHDTYDVLAKRILQSFAFLNPSAA